MDDISPIKVTRRRGTRRSGKGPTVTDVAREAGVSPMTVSRVVNKEANVVPATRARVEAAIARIGYVPNQAARALAGARQCRIALLHDNPSATWLSELLVGCLAQASESDAQLLVERSDRPGSPAQLAAHLVSHRVDGVILPPPLCDDAGLLAALAQAGLAMVQVATGRPAAIADAVAIDDHAAARDMTRSMIALGHRRIGFIAGNPNQTASELRQAGYVSALAEAGIACDPALIVAGDFSYRSGLTAANALLELPDRPTAIFASNDDMAAAVVAMAHRRRLDVPGDLSVCGFDDTALSTTIWPELTTVHQPIGEMARAATRLVIEAVHALHEAAPRAVRHVCLPSGIVTRHSVSAPRA